MEQILDTWFHSHGFVTSRADPCVYIYHGSKNSKDFLAIAIHVDDMPIIDNNPNLRDSILEEMNKAFKVNFLGPANWILNMHIQHLDNGSFQIDQIRYIESMLERFNMTDCNPAKTPIVVDNSEDTSEPFDKNLYMQLIGSLLYLAVISRPDIAFAVSKVGQKAQNPTVKDWKTAKHILRYLAGTKHYLSYSPDGNINLEGYSDADWAGDPCTRRSTSGFVFRLAGAAISWMSKKQPIVALSSTEAEYIAGSLATQEAIYLRTLFQDLENLSADATTMFIDNQAIAWKGFYFQSLN